ncbi:MAG: type II toxin-antitoxin system RelE/ParE family toxin [Oscillibacter sp.]|nr:type II toxin-antitoxin system RelE/ParE family toxin [Oscillibacter sp.]
MNYDIQIDRKALKFINRQPQNQKRRILSAIWKLPDIGDRRPLQGNEGLFRLRVGDYRVIYSVDNGRLTVYVVDAGNRGEIYNRY